jgi:hypothetical protein
MLVTFSYFLHEPKLCKTLMKTPKWENIPSWTDKAKMEKCVAIELQKIAMHDKIAAMQRVGSCKK